MTSRAQFVQGPICCGVAPVDALLGHLIGYGPQFVRGEAIQLDVEQVDRPVVLRSQYLDLFVKQLASWAAVPRVRSQVLHLCL